MKEGVKDPPTHSFIHVVLTEHLLWARPWELVRAGLTPAKLSSCRGGSLSTNNWKHVSLGCEMCLGEKEGLMEA